MPTLPLQQAESQVAALLENNAGCDLPCWWGIVPGETSWAQAHAIVSPLTGGTESTRNDRSLWRRNGGYSSLAFHEALLDLRDERRALIGSLDVLLYERGGRILAVWAESHNSAFANVSRATSPFARTWRFYSLAQVLIRLGMPSRVWLYTFQAAPEGVGRGYELTLFYEPRELIVQYRAWRDLPHDGMISVCPTATEPLGLSVVAESSHDSLPSLDLGWSARSIEESTGWTLDQFYRTYSQPDTQVCMQTPVALWPY